MLSNESLNATNFGESVFKYSETNGALEPYIVFQLEEVTKGIICWWVLSLLMPILWDKDKKAVRKSQIQSSEMQIRCGSFGIEALFSLPSLKLVKNISSHTGEIEWWAIKLRIGRDSAHTNLQRRC